MKILHISTSDANGGAARAAYRIHRALLASNVSSRMHVLHSSTGDHTVFRTTTWHKSLFRWIATKLKKRLTKLSQIGWHTNNSTLHTFGHFSSYIVDELNNSDADILHLHWISGMLSVRDIGRLRKPIVWTLHDMWAFCGGEHYAPDDSQSRFRLGYLKDNRPPHERGPDLNRKTWTAKRHEWAKQCFTIISPSNWLASCAKDSVLLRDQSIYVIPNPLDTNLLWRPTARNLARASLNLPSEPKLVIMGADSGLRDPRKGGDLFLATMNKVIENILCKDVQILIFGHKHRPTDKFDWPCPVHWLGDIKDDNLLALSYSAADLMVVPSRQDNLPNTAVEAQACGIPVVSFKVGGLPDIIDNKVTGSMATSFNTDSLAEEICWVLEDDNRHRAMSANSRRRAVDLFSEHTVAEKYLAAYRKTLDK